MDESRPMPASLEAERAVLGALILLGEAKFADVSGLLKPEDFSSEAHRAIYFAIISLDGKGVDALVLREILKANGGRELVEPGYISGLTDTIPDVIHLEKYAQIVKETALLRKLILDCHRITEAAYKGEAVASLAASTIDALSDIPAGFGKRARPISAIVHDSMRSYGQRKDAEKWISGIPTGIESLDGTILGYQRGLLTVQAARPSMGKTAFALHAAMTAARIGSYRVAYYSLDMPDRLLADRILASEAAVNLNYIRTGLTGERDHEAMIDAAQSVHAIGSRLLVNDSFFSIHEIIAEAKREARRGGLDLVIVDYLQLVAGTTKKNQQRYQEVGDISRQLVMLAKEINAAVVCLAQLNRQSNDTTRPRMAHLYESGRIEQDARTIILLDRPRYRAPENHEIRWCQLFLYVEKNSEGEQRDIECHYNLASQTITDGGCAPGCKFYLQEARA